MKARIYGEVTNCPIKDLPMCDGIKRNWDGKCYAIFGDVFPEEEVKKWDVSNVIDK